MNLLFYTDSKISPTKGGTEHTTLTVANQLHDRYNCRCWSCHIYDENTNNCFCFEQQYTLDPKSIKDNLRSIILENNIDVFFSESNFDMPTIVDGIRKECGLNLIIIFVHHFSPAWEGYRGTIFSACFRSIKRNHGVEKLKCIIKCLFYPYFGRRGMKRLSKEYRKAYVHSDKVVLLTKGYVPEFMKFAHLEDDKKFYVIPNALSLPDILGKSDFNNVKEKVVLVVSRLEEVQKRISLILKIWRKISKNYRAKGWKLLIAGEGVDGERYKKYVSRHNIPNIVFLGRVTPAPYYKEASIFMMTSKSEGFPLTLNEAMQYGVVPLAFDSFAAISDIITDGYNGYVIPDKEVEIYSEKLLNLMSNNNLRHNMAMNAIDSCQRYLPEPIGDIWWKLLNQ